MQRPTISEERWREREREKETKRKRQRKRKRVRTITRKLRGERKKQRTGKHKDI